jgi:hypothetical protein
MTVGRLLAQDGVIGRRIRTASMGSRENGQRQGVRRRVPGVSGSDAADGQRRTPRNGGKFAAAMRFDRRVSATAD